MAVAISVSAAEREQPAVGRLGQKVVHVGRRLLERRLARIVGAARAQVGQQLDGEPSQVRGLRFQIDASFTEDVSTFTITACFSL